MSNRPLALVTGASSGIGTVFARKLAQRGYDLLLVARDGERLAALAAELAAGGASATPVSADLTTEEGLAATEAAITSAGCLDLLVNNAGFGSKGQLAESPLEVQDRMLRLHVIAVNRLTRAALQLMKPARRGGVITVSSVASFVNSTGNVNYCATKAYQRSFSEGLAMECAPLGIRVQALCPGFTHTEFHARMADDQLGRAPAWMWLGADEVVETSLRQLERDGGVICVPGAQYKVAVFLARHLPLWVKRLMVRNVYKRD
ncbi:MAG TPA: SDR family NAD(P)-dependent oxidoreductase [Gemmatimonadaceae bacterium]|nr:SDR family NAD(P)-dependent oxidoreductase [Gemmatimonadaceae bacterium]